LTLAGSPGQVKGDAWIVGCVTMAEFGKGEHRPAKADQARPRATWKATGSETGPYAIAIDQGGGLHINISKANGDPIVAVLVESVANDTLPNCGATAFSYVFAGATGLDLPLAAAG
jgi:hypothetical protein